jgi:hypothetical protein
VITAIAAALLGAGLGGRIGTKRVYMIGLAAGLVSMALLLVSSFVTDDQTLAYALLLLVTASLGAGFGFTVPALNTFTAAFNPTAVSRSILVLNALLGLGTVPAPVFVPAEEVIRKARAKVIRGAGAPSREPSSGLEPETASLERDARALARRVRSERPPSGVQGVGRYQ